MPRLGDRIAGGLLLALAIWYFVAAGGFAVAYGDPAGPVLFPRIVAVPLGLFSLFLILRPDPDVTWFRWPQVGRQLAGLAVMILYPLLLEPLGFPLATILATLALARILEGRWLQSVICGVVVGFGLYVLFDRGFGLPLPAGPFFG